jgi:hypothetical protein
MKKILFIFLFFLLFNLFILVFLNPFNNQTFSYTKESSLNENFNNLSNQEKNQYSSYNLNTSFNLFMEKMRFQNSDISYKIYNCDSQKNQDILYSFNLIENHSILRFYETQDNEDISVFCDKNSSKNFENYLIVGEGGPVNITISGDYKIIKKGEIFLFKKSDCKTPNIAIHELLHVLGFNHSSNSNDIMYPISNCNQKINEDIFYYLNEIYSIPSLPDLEINNISSIVHGRFLDLNASVRNIGLISSINSTLFIYNNNEKIEFFDIGELCEGCTKILSIKNAWIKNYKINNFSIEIKTNEKELNKENNKINLN